MSNVSYLIVEATKYLIEATYATIQFTIGIGRKEKGQVLTTPNCSDAFAFQSLRLVSSLPEIT